MLRIPVLLVEVHKGYREAGGEQDGKSGNWGR